MDGARSQYSICIADHAANFLVNRKKEKRNHKNSKLAREITLRSLFIALHCLIKYMLPLEMDQSTRFCLV